MSDIITEIKKEVLQRGDKEESLQCLENMLIFEKISYLEYSMIKLVISGILDNNGSFSLGEGLELAIIDKREVMVD